MNKFKECNQCPYEFNDKNLEPCKDCVPKKKTNADRIRAMDDEELADYLYKMTLASLTVVEVDSREIAIPKLLKWLQSEAEQQKGAICGKEKCHTVTTA